MPFFRFEDGFGGGGREKSVDLVFGLRVTTGRLRFGVL